MRALRGLLLISLLILGMASASTAAPVVSVPSGYTRFSLGGPEHELVDVQASSSGWVMSGSRVGATGSEALVMAIDTSGRILWQQAIPGSTALALTMTPTGSIWVASIAASAIAATPTPTPTSTDVATPPAVIAPLDPDAISVIEEPIAGRSGSFILLTMLGADGKAITTIDASMPDGWVGQPSALLPYRDGVLVVGTALSPTAAKAGFVIPVSPGSAAAPVMLGTSKTSFTDAALTSSGAVVIAGASGEALLGKPAVGASDAIVATFNGARFTKVVRSTGGQRTWTSIITNPAGGYQVAGSALVSGRREAVVSSYSATGIAIWSRRFPGTIPAEEQRLLRVGSTLSLAIAAQSANATLYPGWLPKGTSDLLVLSLSAARGMTVKVNAIASPGREELVDASGSGTGGVVLLRSDGALPGGTGNVILARLGAR